MSVFPYIFKSIFGDEDNAEFTARDAAINSDLLRAAVEILNPEWDEAAKAWVTKYWWRVRIADQHYNETEPHYELEFGEGDVDSDDNSARIVIPYCDNYSSPERKIEQNPGEFIVEVIGSFGENFAHHLALSLCVAYEKSLREHFPDYYILCDMSKALE